MRRRLLLCWLCAAWWAGCQDQELILTISGTPRDVRWQRATVSAGGEEARPIGELEGGVTLLGLRVPQRPGPLSVELDGLSASRCSVARGAVGIAEPGRERTWELNVTMRRLAAPSCCNAQGWCWDNPLPTGAELLTVWGTSLQDLWIAGEGGGLYRGLGMAPVALHVSVSLRALAGTGSRDVWVGGDGGVLFHYDGTRWQRRDGGMIRGAVSSILALSPTDVWIGASDALYRHDGRAFQRLPHAGIAALWASGSRNVWGVGDKGLVLHYDGTEISTSTPLPGRRLNGIWGSGPGDIWAVGNGGAVLRHDGTRWSVLGMSGPSWRGVWGRGRDEVWMVGEGGSQRYDGGGFRQEPVGGAALLGIWGGADFGPVVVGGVGAVRRWEGGAFAQVAPAGGVIGGSEVLRSVWGSGPGDLWAVGTTGRTVGNKGLIAHYDGAAWSRVLETAAALHDVGGRGARAWAVGEGGAVLRREEDRWVALGSRSAATLRGIFVPPGSGGADFWAVGEDGVVVRGQDAQVEVVGSGTARDLHGIWGMEGALWIAGEGGVVLRGDGGGFAVEPEAGVLSKGVTLRAVWGSGPEDVLVAGEGGVLLRRSQGRWVAELGGTQEDLHRIWGTGAGDVWVAGGEDMSAGQGSALLHFDGMGWTRESTGSGRLALFGVFGTRVGAEGSGRVWAVGEAGAILRRRGY